MLGWKTWTMVVVCKGGDKKMQFRLDLPQQNGFAGTFEYVIWVESRIPVGAVFLNLENMLPQGFKLQ